MGQIGIMMDPIPPTEQSRAYGWGGCLEVEWDDFSVTVKSLPTWFGYSCDRYPPLRPDQAPVHVREALARKLNIGGAG